MVSEVWGRGTFYEGQKACAVVNRLCVDVRHKLVPQLLVAPPLEPGLQVPAYLPCEL